VHVISAEATELFVGPPDAPQQLVRVAYTGSAASMPIRVEGDGLGRPILRRVRSTCPWMS
jgi:hypothetical protein